ncbi:MAG: hypothetical protein QXS85_05490 [Acidilobaceae archaeon]
MTGYLRSLVVFALVSLIAASLVLPLASIARAEAPEEGFEALERALRSLQAALEKSPSPEAQRIREALERALREIEEIKARGGSFEEAVRAVAREMARVRSELRAVELEEAARVPPGLLVAIDVRLRMVEELRGVVAYLEERGVEVDPRVPQLLDEAESRALDLKRRLEAGEVAVRDAARELGEISRLIAEARVLLAKSSREWARLQLENAAARVTARVATQLGAGLLRLEELPEDEIRRAAESIEEAVTYRWMIETRLRERVMYCDIEALLKELGIDKPEPGFFGRAVAKLAREDPQKLREALAKLKVCLIGTMASTEIEKVPGVGQEEARAALAVVAQVAEIAKGIRVEPPAPVTLPIPTARGTARLELSVAPYKTWVRLEPARPVAEIELRGQTGSVTLNLAKLVVERQTTIQVIVDTSTVARGSATISLKITLEGRGGEKIEIPVPCAASSEACYRVLVIIPGHDVPTLIQRGEYTVTVTIYWSIASGEPATSISLQIR